MMDGRVKTLHPKIHGGLLGLRDNPEHTAAMKKHGIEPIDLVCVNLYPFEQTIAKPGCTLEEAIENIDIGGPSMVRSASKNHKFVTIVTSPQQYDRVMEEMKSKDGATSEELRSDFARIAFGLTASYDAAIAKYLNGRADVRYPERFPSRPKRKRCFATAKIRTRTLRFINCPPAARCRSAAARLLEGGTPISFNNLMDTNAAFELVKEFEEPAAVVVKHMNPCGCAVDEISATPIARPISAMS